MHIAYDISQAGRARAGCGFHALALLEAMIEDDGAPERYTLCNTFGDSYFDPTMPYRRPVRHPHVRYGPRQLTRAACAAFWNREGLDEALGQPALVHANNFWCPATIRAAKVVYTCYDLGFALEPDWTTESNRAACFEGMFRAAACADWVVAISEATRRDFLAAFPQFPPERVRVVHSLSRFREPLPAGRPPERLAALRPGGFWLCVGTLEPRKNQRMLVDAYARHRRLGGPAMPLVFAGGRGWLMEGFESEAARSAPDVLFAGYVADDELAWLYRNCFATLYPSRFEGFGLPVLEALQFGAATLVAGTSSLPEVAGDAAWLLPAGDAQAWAAAMSRLANDPTGLQEMRREAPAQAARFGRRRAAAAMRALYAEAAASPRRA